MLKRRGPVLWEADAYDYTCCGTVHQAYTEEK